MDESNAIASTSIEIEVEIEELRKNAENAQMHQDSLAKKLKDEEFALISAKESEDQEAIRLNNIQEEFLQVESRFKNAKLALDGLDVNFEDVAAQLRLRIEALESKLAPAQDELVSIKSDLDDAQESAKKAHTDIEKATKNELVIAQDEVQQTKAEIRNLGDDKKKLAGEIREIQIKAGKLEQVIKEGEHKNKRFEAELKQVKEGVESAIEKEIAAKRELESTKKAIVGIEASIRELDLDAMNSSISKTQNALKIAKKNRRDVHSKLRNVKVDLKYKKDTERDVSNAVKECKKLDKLVADIKSNITSLHKEKDSVKLKIKQKSDDIKDAEKLLRQQEKALKAAEINVHVARKKESVCKSRAMKESTAEAKSQLSYINEEIARKEDSLKNRDVDIEKMRQRMAKAEGINDTMPKTQAMRHNMDAMDALLS